VILRLAALGLVIAANNFSAALALGALGQRSRRARIVAVFGVFEFLVPLAGIAIGRSVAGSLADTGRWVGAALLAALGMATLLGGIRGHAGFDDDRMTDLVTSWGGLTFLAAGLSLDNLVIGFGLGPSALPPLAVAGTIAVFSMGSTWIGVGLGSELRRHWEQRAEIASGILLTSLAIGTAAGWL
jgi:putative Mn2+ efflux pump MntP